MSHWLHHDQMRWRFKLNTWHLLDFMFVTFCGFSSKIIIAYNYTLGPLRQKTKKTITSTDYLLWFCELCVVGTVENMIVFCKPMLWFVTHVQTGHRDKTCTKTLCAAIMGNLVLKSVRLVPISFLVANHDTVVGYRAASFPVVYDLTL